VAAGSATDEPEALVAYCALPSCRKEFRRVTGPGRRKDFCSETCRRASEKELRQLRSRLTHFQALVEQVRIDISAYGRDSDEGSEIDAEQRAVQALARARGVLRFAPADDPGTDELRALIDAVGPFFEVGARRAG
jgi:hypothetical protein